MKIEADAGSGTQTKTGPRAGERVEAREDSSLAPGRRIARMVTKLFGPRSAPPKRRESPAPAGASDIESWMVERLAALMELGHDEIDVRIPIERFGLDSRSTVGMTGELEDWLGIELPATLLWDYPTIAEASAFLAEEARLVRPSKIVSSGE